MATVLPLILLILGLAIGGALGWLAHASTASRPEPAAEPPALQLQPLERAVDELRRQFSALEEDRTASLASLTSQVQAVSRSSARLTDHTDKLVTALRSPNVRGRWGEVQLQRVVELGGMVEHVDFEPQVTARIGERAVRPDMLIKLAGGRHIVVDAKAPFSSYLDALETTDPEEHAAFLRRHANLLRRHIQELAKKDYLAAFHPTPEFVVLFVPADPFLDAALSVDPDLLEFGFANNVVLATPTSLFALLRTAALGWRTEDASAKAREVLRLGSELYDRLNTLNEHYDKVGRALERTVDAYNTTLASLDSRVAVTARRLRELEVPARGNRLPREPRPVQQRPRRTM